VRVLVLEDEPALREHLARRLRDSGFVVDEAADGVEGEYAGLEFPLDVAIVDLGLPGQPGLDVIRAWRMAGRSFPILILTARDRWQEKVEALQAGADDYVTKPFSPRELVARVRAVLRRARGDVQPSGVIRIGDLVIDLVGRGVTVDGQPVSLTPTEFDLLAVMARNPGRPFTRAQLMDLVYDVAYAGYDRAIDSHIKNLRRKIEPDPANPTYIQTVYGVGYRLRGEP